MSYFTNLAFDNVTNKTFVTAFNTTANYSYIFELLPDQSLRKLVDLPWEFSNGAYSSSRHIFFLVLSIKPAMNHLLSVSTEEAREGKVLYNVAVAFEILSFAFHDPTGVVYAWGTDPSTNEAGLFGVDFTSGSFVKALSQVFPLDVGLNSCLNKQENLLYTFMYDIPTNQSVIVTADLGSGTSAEVSVDRRFLTMNSRN